MAYTQRTADWTMQKAWLEAKLKGTAPLAGTTKYTILLSLIDSELKNWESEDGIEWDSLYSRVTIGTVSATDTFALSTSIKYISKHEGDPVYLLSADGTQKKIISLVRPNQLYDYKDDQCYAAIEGRNLVFSRPFDATSSYIGYSIVVPSYGYTNDITSGSSIVNCDAPLYIAYMTAASYARNDLIKAGQYNNILDKAAVLMNKMKQQNSGQREEIGVEVAFVGGETWA